MTHFWDKNLGLILENKIHRINSAKILSKFCLHKFSPKLNPIWEKRVLNFNFNTFCLVNLNQHCTISRHGFSAVIDVEVGVEVGFEIEQKR